MRGFAVGSLALIVLYVALQRRTTQAAVTGGNWLVEGMQRLLSPNVAGVPQRGAAAGKEAKKGTKP